MTLACNCYLTYGIPACLQVRVLRIVPLVLEVMTEFLEPQPPPPKKKKGGKKNARNESKIYLLESNVYKWI